MDLLPKPSQVANHTNGPTYIQSIINDSDDGISYKGLPIVPYLFYSFIKNRVTWWVTWWLRCTFYLILSPTW